MFEHDYSSIYEPFIYESLWAIHNILTESPDSWIYQPWLLVNCPVFLEKEGDGKDDKGCVSCKAQKTLQTLQSQVGAVRGGNHSLSAKLLVYEGRIY